MNARVQFAAPMTLEDAFTVISALGSGAALIAGGQELMPALNLGEFEPTVLIDITNIDELEGIELDAGSLSIGALSTHRQVERSQEVRQAAPLLAHSVAQIGGGWQVRNRGTIGGNIVSVHPLYDVLPALLALHAKVEIATAKGTTVTPVSDVILDASHGLGSKAILTRVIVDTAAPWDGWGYSKLKATSGDYASATAAALVRTGSGDRPAEVRLIVSSVEALPRDLSALATDIVAKHAGDALGDRIEAAVEAAITAPLDDHKGGADYRRAMAGVVAARAIAQAIATADSPKEPAA